MTITKNKRNKLYYQQNKNKWKAYRENNIEKIREATKNYRERIKHTIAYREKHKQQTIKWQKANPEKVKITKRLYYQKNKEKILARERMWRKNNPDKCREYKRRYRKKHPQIGWLKLRFETFKRNNFTCYYCGRKPPECILHVDHIHPISKKGERYKKENLITACSDCNYGKTDILLSEHS